MGNRTLVYTCCDKKYSHFVPLFCASLLYSNDEIDIEIGLSCESLDPKETSAIQALQKLYPKSKILLKYNFFKIDTTPNINAYKQAIFEGKRMMINSVRFVSEPKIKNDYTYISDVDIISLDKNFYLYHIKAMKERNMIYDNIVRESNSGRLSGLHFVKTDAYYPLDLNGLDFVKNDEFLLKNITERKTKINHDLVDHKYRPVHGPHISLNRPEPAGTGKIPSWSCKNYKNAWKLFKSSPAYKAIEKSFDPLISKQLNKLDEYYTTI